MLLQRVDELDEVFVNKSEQPMKQSRVEGYESQIIPRYKEAVLTAWEVFEGFSSRKPSLQSSDLRSRRTHQVLSSCMLSLEIVLEVKKFVIYFVAVDSHYGNLDDI